MMDYQRVGSLEDVWRQATERCSDGAVFNLILAHEFEIGLAESPFVVLHEDAARNWQSETRPKNLPFSHGEYFHGTKGIDHIVQELRSKTTSRRALISLVNMDDLLASGDQPIPSFLIAQCGIEGDSLYVTAYFRALETIKFLPINLAEVALLIRRLRNEFPQLRLVRLLIIAFRAYSEPDFVLDRAQMDIEPRGAIAMAVSKREIARLTSWLENKKKSRSLFEVGAIEEMRNAMDAESSTYPLPVRNAMQEAIASLEALADLRSRASEGERLEMERNRFVGALDKAIKELHDLAARA